MIVSNGSRELSRPLLLIDDDVELCGMMADFFSTRGFSLEYLHDGGRGLVRALEGRHHLVLLDITLPIVNGLDVLRQVRRRSPVPVIMLTARGDRVERVVGLTAGADDYLAKPFGTDELLARVHAVLRRAVPRPSPPGERLTVGGIGIETARRQVCIDGQLVRLTAVEYDLLEYLVRAAGRVVSREELVMAVCQREASPFDRSLDVHISHLRAKLYVERSCIRTVRGVGYVCQGDGDTA